jgi:hypothetical protein
LRDHAIPKDNSDTSVIDSLRPLKGAEFDKAYVQKVGVQGYKDAIQHNFSLIRIKRTIAAIDMPKVKKVKTRLQTHPAIY